MLGSVRASPRKNREALARLMIQRGSVYIDAGIEIVSLSRHHVLTPTREEIQ
jgi:hypothetical protein